MRDSFFVRASVGCCLLALAAGPVTAQDRARAEVSGGYVFSSDVGFNGAWPLGGFVGAAWPAAEWLAVSAELAGSRKHETFARGQSDFRMWSALLGGRVSRRIGPSVTPFVRGAWGMTQVTNHTSSTSSSPLGVPFDVTIAITAPAVQLGAGADVDLGKRISLRSLVEYRRIFDRRLRTLELPIQNSFVATTGLAIALGSR